jgi:hypothetical protein
MCHRMSSSLNACTSLNACKHHKKACTVVLHSLDFGMLGANGVATEGCLAGSDIYISLVGNAVP